MDSFYEHDDARAWTEQHLTTSVQHPSPFNYLANLRVDTKNVTMHQDPRSLRLTEEIQEGTQEVEVRIPGIICSKSLPPQQRELSSSNPEHVRLLRQFVKLSGLGSVMFEDLAQKMEAVWGAFVLAAAPATVEPLVFKAYDGDYAIDAHTRYFTDRRHAPTLKHGEMPSTIDPHRHLDSIRGANFIYTEENYVEYCERLVSVDGHVSYIPLAPDNFQVGDIVEVGAAFVAYPAGKDNYVLKVAMRSLCLLNNQFRKDATARREAFHHNSSRSSTTSGNKRTRRDSTQLCRPLLKRRLLTSTSVPADSTEDAPFHMFQ
ncbi:hypothetical protein MD484_g3161, partial [Candolleomyces efflorescens]